MEKVDFCGHRMTEEQQDELATILTEDILERYNYAEYWNISVIDDFCDENDIKRIKK